MWDPDVRLKEFFRVWVLVEVNDVGPVAGAVAPKATSLKGGEGERGKIGVEEAEHCGRKALWMSMLYKKQLFL